MSQAIDASQSLRNALVSTALSTQGAMDTAQPASAKEQVVEKLRQFKIHGHDFTDWQRVRIIVCQSFLDTYTDWDFALRERLADIGQLSDPQKENYDLVVVGIQSLEEELSEFEASCRRVPCRPHPEIRITPENQGLLEERHPVVDSMRFVRWNEQLRKCCSTPVQVVELGLAPHILLDDFLHMLNSVLENRRGLNGLPSYIAPPGGTSSSAAMFAALHLNDIVPPQVTSAFAASSVMVQQDQLLQRHVLKDNPLAGTRLREAESNSMAGA